MEVPVRRQNMGRKKSEVLVPEISTNGTLLIEHGLG